MSLRADVPAILPAAGKPASRVKMGQALWELGREIQLSDEDVAVMEKVQDTLPAAPISFDE